MAREILLIEDNLGQQEAISKFIFAELGYSEIPCATLADVQAIVPTLAQAPVGILLDFQIPPGAGQNPILEAGRDCGLYLRGMLRGSLIPQIITANVPIIAYTQYEDDRFAGWADIIGIAMVLKKYDIGIADIEAAVRANFP